MGIELGRAALPSLLLLGCTGLNPLYADATGGQAESGPGTTTRATEPNPSSPTDPSRPTTPNTQSTLEPTDGSGDSTTGTGTTGTGTAGTETSSEGSSGTTTGTVSGDCSTYEQDCPPAQKCMPWAGDRGRAWNALGCFSLDPNPVGPGDACEVFEAPTSGRDNCTETSMCWDVSAETGVGACVPFCSGSPDAPVCTDAERTCVVSNDGVIALCQRLCDPLLQDCGTGSACLPTTSDAFTCTPDASGDGGEVGDVCEFVNGCNIGNLCANGDVLNGCEGLMCCTSFCSLGEPDPCEGPSVCVAYYADGTAPPGYEDLGYCGIG